MAHAQWRWDRPVVRIAGECRSGLGQCLSVLAACAGLFAALVAAGGAAAAQDEQGPDEGLVIRRADPPKPPDKQVVGVAGGAQAAVAPEDKNDPSPENAQDPKPDDKRNPPQAQKPSDDDDDERALEKKRKERLAEKQGNGKTDEKQEKKDPLGLKKDPPAGKEGNGQGPQKGVEKPPAKKAPEPQKPEPVLCRLCADTGRVRCPSHNPKNPLVRIEGEQMPPCCQGVGWFVCRQCGKQGDKDARTEAAQRTAEAGKSSRPCEEAMKIKLLDSESDRIAFHIEGGNRGDSIAGAKVAEILFAEVQKTLGEKVADEIRSPGYQIYVLRTTERYRAFCDWAVGDGVLKDHQFDNGQSWIELSKQCGGFAQRGTAVIDRQRSATAWLHMAAANMSSMILALYCTKEIPDWLSSGFAGWAQVVSLNSIQVYEINYELGKDNPMGAWPAMVRKAIAQRTVKSWKEIFGTSLVGAKAIDHAYFYSVVSYLIARDGKAFARFLADFGAGTGLVKALEDAYGATLAKIESDWQQWAAKQVK